MTEFDFQATTLAFNCDPVRDGNSQDITRRQVAGRYSDGRPVIYDKSSAQRGVYTLQFKRLTGAVLDELLSFFALVQGVRYAFTWTDHLGTVRSVKFSSSAIKYSQVGPDRFAVEFSLNEDDPL